MQDKILAILGRQPALGLAELESLFGANNITPIQNAAVLELVPSEITGGQLGGTLKLAQIIDTTPSKSWSTVRNHLANNFSQYLTQLMPGKLTLGLSAYGFDVKGAEISATALSLKKICKSTGRPVRIVPNKEPALNTAQVLHNKLANDRNMELIAHRTNEGTVIARTFFVQDIEAYGRRDQQRPARDAKVGMLPPKLAQTLINLAHPPLGSAILDPFCGTGVVLQEAAVMRNDYQLYGSDINERMIAASKINLDWLQTTLRLNFNSDLQIADATKHVWQPSPDSVVSEVFLGRPFASLPPKDLLDKAVIEANHVVEAFMRNLSLQLRPGTRLCLAVPAWRLKNGFRHLPALDRLTEMGYNRVSFVHAGDSELIYHRPDQVVARELVILEKK